MKTLILIAAIAATAISTALSLGEDAPITQQNAMPSEDDASRRNIYVNNERAEKQLYYTYKSTPWNTREIRIRRGEQRRRETAVMTDEFVVLAGRVQIRVEAKFGGPAEALKHPDAIKYDCYFHATEFCRKYNDSDSGTRAYEMQEYVTTSLQEKAIKIANKSNTLANTLVSN
jgi:hypothetical protein